MNCSINSEQIFFKPLFNYLFTMKSKLILTLLAVAVMSLGVKAGTDGNIAVDTENSTVGWFAKKMGGAHDGHVNVAEGNLVFKESVLVSGEIVIDMASISCADISNEGMNKKLVGHLKSADFFNTAEFTKATLKITGAEKVDATTYKVSADITIKGITKQIKFESIVGEAEGKVTATAEIELDRTEFDVRYGSKKFFDNLGDKFIYDTFKLAVNLVGQ